MKSEPMCRGCFVALCIDDPPALDYDHCECECHYGSKPKPDETKGKNVAARLLSRWTTKKIERVS